MSLGEEDWKASQRCEELPLRSHQCRHRATVARRHHPPLRQNTIVFLDESRSCFHCCSRHTRTSLCSFHPFPTKKQVDHRSFGLKLHFETHPSISPSSKFMEKNNYCNPTINKDDKATFCNQMVPQQKISRHHSPNSFYPENIAYHFC